MENSLPLTDLCKYKVNNHMNNKHLTFEERSIIENAL